MGAWRSPCARCSDNSKRKRTFAVMSVQPLSRKNWRAASLPPATIAFSSSGVHLSSSVDLRSKHRAAQELVMNHQTRRDWQGRRASGRRGGSSRTAPGTGQADAPDEANVRAHPPVLSRAVQADKDAICYRSPRGISSAAIETILQPSTRTQDRCVDDSAESKRGSVTGCCAEQRANLIAGPSLCRAKRGNLLLLRDIHPALHGG
jgi:hypothetical protein